MINKANTKEDLSKSNLIQTIINKRLKFHNLTIFVRPIFQKDKKYYPQVLLDESSDELYMLVNDKVDFSERMTNASKNVIFVIIGIFLDKAFKILAMVAMI